MAEGIVRFVFTVFAVFVAAASIDGATPRRRFRTA